MNADKFVSIHINGKRKVMHDPRKDKRNSEFWKSCKDGERMRGALQVQVQLTV